MPAIPPLTFETERLIMRPVRLSDARAIYEAMRDPKLQGPMRNQQGQGIKATYKSILRGIVNRRRGKRLDLAYIEKATGRLIGIWSATNVDLKTNKSAEMALWILPEFWRQGILSEAEDQIETFFYRDLGLHRFVARIREGNTAIIGVVEGRGWTLEARFREYGLNDDGSLCDFLQYSILSTDPGAIEAMRRAGYEPPATEEAASTSEATATASGPR